VKPALREQYFDHDADMGIIGYGNRLEQSFEDAARVTFSIMTDLAQVNPLHSVTITFVESDVELALVTWLNLLLAKAHEKHFVFCQFHLIKKEDHWQGEASGERWREDMERGVEVKGATLTMLSVTQRQDQYEARCVVDI
jgi:SHS2 domain-containing protein